MHVEHQQRERLELVSLYNFESYDFESSQYRVSFFEIFCNKNFANKCVENEANNAHRVYESLFQKIFWDFVIIHMNMDLRLRSSFVVH